MSGGGSQGFSDQQAAQLAQLLQQNAGGINASNYASSNQNFMQYPQQGQPNQPVNPQTYASPDITGNASGVNMGFDGSGSDAGVAGQPVNQMQNPLQGQGNKPLSFSQFQQPQGLQIQGNPTSQIVQRPQQR